MCFVEECATALHGLDLVHPMLWKTQSGDLCSSGLKWISTLNVLRVALRGYQQYCAEYRAQNSTVETTP